jgi:hypothetical protein
MGQIVGDLVSVGEQEERCCHYRYQRARQESAKECGAFGCGRLFVGAILEAAIRAVVRVIRLGIRIRVA